MAKDILFNDLDDDLVQLVINQLPALFQVAVTRVCSRFKKVALKTTKILDVEDIPYNQRIGIAKKMIQLESVRGVYYIDSDDEDSDSDDDEHQFMKTLGEVNPNITNCKGWAPRLGSLFASYVKSVKSRHQAYTGSKLNFIFESYQYSKLIFSYPDLQLKHSVDYEYGSHFEQNENHLHTYKLDFKSTNSDRVTSILSKTINLTKLTLELHPQSETFRLNSILESISKLPLKHLSLFLFEICAEMNPNLGYHLNVKESLYSMVPDDYKSLQAVFNIRSLRSAGLGLFVANVDQQAIYESFVNSSNNHFNFISLGLYQKGVAEKPFIHSVCQSKWVFNHEINIDSLLSFDISTFVNKFKRNPDSDFKIICTHRRIVSHD